MKELEFPKRLMLEVTNFCNHKCIYCANSKTIRNKGYIEPKFAKKVLREAYDLGSKEVSFHAIGEPLLCKELSEYIKLAKEIGYKYIYIDTNGALADSEIIAPILDAGLDSIKFSIGAGTRETYKKIHGRDDFDRTIRNLKNMYEYRKNKKMNFKIYTSYVITNDNQYEVEVFKKMVEKYCDDIWFEPVSNQAGNMNVENGDMVIATDSLRSPSVKIPCNEIFDRIVVTYDQKVTACCMDFDEYLTYADLSNTSLEEAWNNVIITELRNRHINNNVKGILCERCVYAENADILPLI